MNRFVIADSILCIGCHICEAACSETRRQHGLQSMPHLEVVLNGKESASQLCYQCGDTPCAIVCLASAINRVDDTVQLNENPCVSCKLCGITRPLGVMESSGSCPLRILANANTPKAFPVPSAPARASSLLGWVPGVRAITVECDLRSFGEQDPVYMRVYPIKALHLVSNMDIARASKRKRELTLNIDFGDLTLFQ